MSDHDLEDYWKAVRPEGIVLEPDTFQGGETVTPNGVIIPIHITEPEFVGSIPARTELTVLPADDPNRPTLGWSVRELTPEEAAERDTPANLRRLQDLREQPPFQDTAHSTVWTSLPVLNELWGREWNVGAANFIRALRPSEVRVVRSNQPVTTDAVTWRVTVTLTEEGDQISSITQEVEVQGTGFRDGQDASNFYRGRVFPLMQPRSSFIVNSRAVSRLNVAAESPAPEDDWDSFDSLLY